MLFRSGDHLSGVKRKAKEMKKAPSELENIFFEEDISPILPKSWRKDMKDALLEPKEEQITLEGKILAAADIIHAIIEVINEINLGNKLFDKQLRELGDSLMEVDIDCARYFIKYCLGDFEIPSHMYGERIAKFIKLEEIDTGDKGEKMGRD